MDLPSVVQEALRGDARPADGLLHASSHLTGPLRHVQLDLAEAPQRPRAFTDEITLMTGTLWHQYIERVLQGLHLPLMTEVNLTPYMPEGWGGTADYLFWSDEHRAFVLGDLKTIKGAGLPWIISGGAKEAHLWQLSAYWYALRDMGLPLVEGFGVLYLPKDGLPGKDIQPTVVECALVDEFALRWEMDRRKMAVEAYLADPKNLAPIPEREAKRIWVKKTGHFDVVLKPHWSSAYCRFEDCGCSELGQTKVGHYQFNGDTVWWIPRDINLAPYEYIDLRPTPKDFP